MKKTWWRKSLILFFGVILLAAFVSTARAVTITWTDDGTYQPSAGGSNPITYTLDFSPIGGSTSDFSALFTIDTTLNVSPEWRVGWVAFKFSPAGGDLSSLAFSDGIWGVGLDSTSLPWGAAGPPGNITPFSGSWAGFYANSLIGSDGASGGLSLTGPGNPLTYTFGFDFEIDDPGKVFTDDMPFKAGFYDGYAGPKVKTDQLSEHLSVPEPATVLLLGSGLLGLALLARRRSKHRKG